MPVQRACGPRRKTAEKLRWDADFKALGYSDADLDRLNWNDANAPAITEQDLNLLVSKPKPGWSWIFWLVGVALIFGIFEFFVSRKLKKPNHVAKDE